MATSDLMSELQKDSIQLDEDSERKVVKMLMRLLEDRNGEVQNLAVKWCVSCQPGQGRVRETAACHGSRADLRAPASQQRCTVAPSGLPRQTPSQGVKAQFLGEVN